MKAKDAAAVFEKLDTDVLLALLERMNERRMGAILAAMDPLRAQEVTVALAKAHEERLSAVPAGAARTLETPAPMGLPELEPILPDVAG